MEPSEKWIRLKNPGSISDYGLTLTENNLRSFPEGRCFLLGIKREERKFKNACRHSRRAGEVAGKVVAGVAIMAIRRAMVKHNVTAFPVSCSECKHIDRGFLSEPDECGAMEGCHKWFVPSSGRPEWCPLSTTVLPGNESSGT